MNGYLLIKQLFESFTEVEEINSIKYKKKLKYIFNKVNRL